jgi:hypothetical protein
VTVLLGQGEVSYMEDFGVNPAQSADNESHEGCKHATDAGEFILLTSVPYVIIGW